MWETQVMGIASWFFHMADTMSVEDIVTRQQSSFQDKHESVTSYEQEEHTNADAQMR